MKQASAAYVAVCTALIGLALGYALPGYARLPNLVYDPLARRFFVGDRPGPIPMGYYGQLLYGMGVGLAAGTIAWLLARRRARDLSAQGAALLAAWTLTALALVAAWFTWNNWP